jgi:hypothetical protein
MHHLRYFSQQLWNGAIHPLSLTYLPTPFSDEEANAKISFKKKNLWNVIQNKWYLTSVFCLPNLHFLHYTTINVSESKRGPISLQPLV